MSNAITTINPATGRALKTYDTMNSQVIEAVVARGHKAALAWGQQPVSVRVDAVRKLAEELRRQKDDFAQLITDEMGKPVAEAAGELEKSAVTALYYADNAKSILSDESVDIDGAYVWVSYEPIGLVLAVMPWNFPVWQVMRFALPALIAGNGVLLKHSPNVTGCALEIEKLCASAGLPKHLISTLVVAESEVPQLSDRLINDDRVAAVTLTGSNRAGAAVGAAAGRASKKSVLELGGSDAFVVLDDADIDAAAQAAVKARFHNAGQSCVCAKRFIIASAVAQEFTDAFLKGVEALVVGNPSEAGTQIGPLARDDLRDALTQQVQDSLKAGAKLLIGGEQIPGDGFYFAPTVLGDVTPGMRVFDEETFGPVAAISIAQSDEDAIRLANQSDFGLSISIWSASTERAVNLAKKITTGAVFINAITASDARVPFGGTKKSGYGRELAFNGLREFTNIRTYWAAKQ